MTFVLSVLSALCVALLWGGNITAVYPLVEVVLDRKSAPEWVDEQIVASEQMMVGLEARADVHRTAIEAARSDAARADSQSSLTRANDLLDAEHRALARYQWLKPHLDAYAPSSPFRTLVIVCILILVGTLLKSLFRISGEVLVARLAQLSTFEIRKEFYRRTLRLDLASFSKQGQGDLISRFTTDLNYVAVGVQTLFGAAVREPLKAVVCLIGAAMISWQLLLITLIFAPPAGYLVSRLAKSLKRANRRALTELAGIYETLGETLGNMKIIKAFTMESQQRREFHQSSKQFYRRSMKIARYNSLVSPLTEIMGMAMIIVAILVGGYLAIEQKTHLFGFLKISDRPLDRGSLMLFYALLAGASDPARRLSNVFGRLQQAAAASDRVYEMLDREPTIADPAEPKPLPHLTNGLQFEGVCFSYQVNEPVLQGIDLTITASETIALVGPNGCGKSTLAGLVTRFYDPNSGRVAIDGVDLRDVRIRDLRQRIGVVTQEAMLLNESVAENIRYGKPTASDEEVVAAATKAHAHAFITNKLSDGYATIVGPGGGRLSGGQRQRIALARAILRDPEILILDEATSQIDVESERLIHEVLADFTRARTTILITHRPSTLALADRIIVLEQGLLLDAGTREQLLGRCELFRRLTHVGLRESA